MYLVCGEALFDVFGVTDPHLPHNRLDFQAVAGGSPFNVALGLARLGVDCAFLAALSRDPLGQRLRQILMAEGVRPDYLVELDAPTTLAMVHLDASGSPHYSFRGEGCADRLLRPEHLPELDAQVRGLHLGSYSLMVQPIGDTLLSLVRRESGRRLVSLDPNVRLNVEPDASRWRQRLDELARHAQLIKVSDEDLSLLYPDTAPERVIDDWLALGCRLVLLTRGAQGASAFSPRLGRLDVPARTVRMRDTVGAGDTFQAAALAFLAEHGLDEPAALADITREQLESLLRFAGEAAALTCSRTGPDLPHRHELDALTARQR
jgi:fructokinase